LGDAAQLRPLLFTQQHIVGRHDYLDASSTSNVYSATGH
jgi:hypothetical protein